MDIHSVIQIDFVKALIAAVCGPDTELVVRNDSFAIRSQKEAERDIHRIIVLPPRGFTANAINQMNSHDEASDATIEVKGVIRDGKRGFSKLKDCLLVASKHENGVVSELTHPYLTFDLSEQNGPDLTLTKHSAGVAPFSVVKSDGYGFYHNLINLTDEWLVLKLHKKLRPQKPVNLDPHLRKLSATQGHMLTALYKAIVNHGDAVFQTTPHLVDAITALPAQIPLPALAEMLYVHDSGKHEACTAFAVMLKIGQKAPMITTQFLKRAMSKETIPRYYAEQLIGKIQKTPTITPQRQIA